GRRLRGRSRRGPPERRSDRLGTPEEAGVEIQRERHRDGVASGRLRCFWRPPYAHGEVRVLPLVDPSYHARELVIGQRRAKRRLPEGRRPGGPRPCGGLEARPARPEWMWRRGRLWRARLARPKRRAPARAIG